ncbi:uncharacterized protein [Penaeus vannamei]|uniref:uncharacterized protein isoform X2 n=1 Tax=Penaeus vannamei TaxID=6689 RepID=UPI00387F518B
MCGSDAGIHDSFADSNPGPIPIATPPVVQDLPKDGDTLVLSEEIFTYDEEAAAQGPSCEEESARPTCSSQTTAPKRKRQAKKDAAYDAALHEAAVRCRKKMELDEIFHKTQMEF